MYILYRRGNIFFPYIFPPSQSTVQSRRLMGLTTKHTHTIPPRLWPVGDANHETVENSSYNAN